MNLVIMMCIGLSVWNPASTPVAQKDLALAKPFFVGTWLHDSKPNRRLKVKISDTFNRLTAHVSYLGTYGEYKPWPETSQLVTFTNIWGTGSAAPRAMANWSFENGDYETWVFTPGGKQLQIETYTKAADGRQNDFVVERYKKVREEPVDEE